MVSEGDSINVGSPLILTDVDSTNSIVYIDRVLVEVVDGSPVERLSFTSSVSPSEGSGVVGEGSSSDSGGLLQPTVNNSLVILILLT